MNIGKATPNLLISLSSSGDGSLDLQIIDDENTTTYFPGDKFTIVFNSVITGVDFLKAIFSVIQNRLITMALQEPSTQVKADW